MELKAFFYKIQIDWKSIVELQKRDQRLLIFLRRSGLLLNRLYGLFDAKAWDQPVVLFISNEGMTDQLEEEIRAHLVQME